MTVCRVLDSIVATVTLDPIVTTATLVQIVATVTVDAIVSFSIPSVALLTSSFMMGRK
jgi:hypothetical protein